MNELGTQRAYGSLTAADTCTEHVDIFLISVRDRCQRLLAKVRLDAAGEFAVHAEGSLEKKILSRIEASTLNPRALGDLGFVFDAPQMMATQPHSMEQCPFGCSVELGLTARKPLLALL